MASCLSALLLDKDDKVVLSRSYTPVSPVDAQGHFDLVGLSESVKMAEQREKTVLACGRWGWTVCVLYIGQWSILNMCIVATHGTILNVWQIVKTYPLPGGQMSRHIAGLEPGQPLFCRGPWPKLPYVVNKWPHIGMLAGGTGITPMLQILRPVLGHAEDRTRVSIVVGNETEPDILLREELDEWAVTHPKQFNLHWTVSHPPAGWPHGHGFIDADMVAKSMPPPGPRALVLVCGPNAMLDALCGPKVGLVWEFSLFCCSPHSLAGVATLHPGV